ncbi:MAG: glycosyltransferase family 2 protein, partial [Rhodospirillales bacterium]|nr:glycosyltransferase family 2 protein [Rhodospirillales bacterium]
MLPMNIEPRFLSELDPAPGTPLISVVVPVHNEAPNLKPLISAISAALEGIAHEIVYVDDGSSDATPQILAEAAETLPTLVRVRHKQSCGQSGAVVTGVKTAHGIYVATLDGDGQNDPADIPAMLEAMRTAEAKGP